MPPVQPQDQEKQIREYFHALYQAWGPQHWWPARTRLEIIVGAYLTQNAAWTNVEKALDQLRTARVLSMKGLREIPVARLQRLIRPAGYFRQKTRSLKTFVKFVDNQYGGSLARMFSEPTAKLRAELLALNGVGPETADSILLYAGNHPVFVVDAYTRRILDRHAILPAKATYEDIREMFERSLSRDFLEWSTNPDMRQWQRGMRSIISAHPPSPMSRMTRPPLVQIYNEMHGLLVRAAKEHCRKEAPSCEQCPLQRYLGDGPA